MELATIVNSLVRLLILVFGWRHQMLRRYALFYAYVVTSLIVNGGLIATIDVWHLQTDDARYFAAYVTATVVVHGFACILLIDAYRRFSDFPRFRGFAIALFSILGANLFLAPVSHYGITTMYVLYMFEAYCGYRAAVAALLRDVDPGWNWKAIIGGLFLSSAILAVNRVGSVAAPDAWPYEYFATALQAAWMAMWIIFLIGMSRYSPPEPVLQPASQKKEAVV